MSTCCRARPMFDKVELRDDGRTLIITYQKNRVSAVDILDAVQAHGLGIVDVSTREADLEDIFLHLTSAPAPEHSK